MATIGESQGARGPSARARGIAERSFDPGSKQADQLATALTLLEDTSARGVLDAIDTDELRIVHGTPEQGGAGIWESPWRPDRMPGTLVGVLRGEPARHTITVDDISMEDPRELAATIAHEGTHYELSQREWLHLPIMGASYLAGLAAFAMSLPTLGMLDLTGRTHRPGTGAIVSAMQGSQLVSSMTHENHAYRVGDRAATELGLEHNGYVRDEQDRELGWARGGWNIARDYMGSAADSVAPDGGGDEPGALRMALMPALGIGIGTATYLGARRFGLSPTLARAVTFGPGLVAFGAGLLMMNRD